MGSPVDDALDRQLVPLTRAAAEAADADLQAEFMRLNPELQRRVALGVLEIDALRRQVEQLREERDAAQRMADHMVTLDGPNAWAIANAERHRAESAEAEVQRLRGGISVRDALVTENAIRAAAAEAEVQRLREERDAGLRLTLTRIGHAPWCKCDICAPTRELLGGAAMSFSGPSQHRCKCFGEGDGPNGTYYPCPPELCEAEALLARAEAAEAEVQRLREGLREAVDMIRFPCAECKPFIDKARALLAAPAGEHTEGEGGEA